MTRQRVLIVTAAAGNALLVLPSLVLLIWVWRDLGGSSDPLDLLTLAAVNVMAVPALVLSVFNLWCVRSAWVLRGDKRAKAIKWGLRSCAALAVVCVVLLLVFPILVLVLAPIAYATAATLRCARAQSKKGWLCPHCEYNLTGLCGTICPECGTQFRPEAGT